MLPALIFVILVTQIPFAITIIISFMNWNAAYPDDIAFGTLQNYVTVFTDANLLKAVFVTVGLTVGVGLASAVGYDDLGRPVRAADDPGIQRAAGERREQEQQRQPQ